MKFLKKYIQIFLIVASALQLIACSRTVQWDEEVPLNTGETIWVKRIVEYSLKGESGNPFNFGYGQNYEEALSFEWRGKRYAYKGSADLMVLAISPQKQPVLVAPAANKGWDWNNNYYCATPHYVQFVPDASGQKWIWPPEIETWLYGLPSNLMRQRRKPGEMQTLYSSEQRKREDAISSMQSPSASVIDSQFTKNINECKRKS